MRPDPDYFEETSLGKPYDARLLRRLTPFVRSHGSLLLWSIGLVVLITLLDVILPYVTKLAIDRHIVPFASEAAVGDRRLKLDVSDPAAGAVLQRHPDLAQVEGAVAYIPYEALASLDREDLARLRRADLTGLALIAGDLWGSGDFRFSAQLRPVGHHGDHRPADHARVAHAVVQPHPGTGPGVLHPQPGGPPRDPHDQRHPEHVRALHLVHLLCLQGPGAARRHRRRDARAELEAGAGQLHRPAGGGRRFHPLLQTRPPHLPHPAGAGGRNQHPLCRNHRRHARHPALPPGGRQLPPLCPAEPRQLPLRHGADPGARRFHAADRGAGADGRGADHLVRRRPGAWAMR